MTLPVVGAILLGQLAGEEVEVGLALDLLEGRAQLGAERLVGEGEPALEVLAEDHLREGLDQRVVEDLGLRARRALGRPLGDRELCQVGGDDRCRRRSRQSRDPRPSAASRHDAPPTHPAPDEPSGDRRTGRPRVGSEQSVVADRG